MRVIEALVAARRQAVRHRTHLLCPDSLGAQVADVHACDALHIRRQAFSQPEVVVTDLGQREVDHLVHQHPVVEQLVGGDVAAQLQTDEWH
jgi:hypothetical protein